MSSIQLKVCPVRLRFGRTPLSNLKNTMKYNSSPKPSPQYIAEADREAAAANNTVLLYIQKFGLLYGTTIWLLLTIFRAVEINALVLSRWKIGRSSFGTMSLVVNYMLWVVLAVFDLNALKNPDENVFGEFADQLKQVWAAVVNPFLLFSFSPVLALFNLLTTGLALGNKALEQILPEKDKPKLHSRGDSILLSLMTHFTQKAHNVYIIPIFHVAESLQVIAMKTDLWGVYHRLIQPLLLMTLAYFLCKYGDLVNGFNIVGFVLFLGAIIMLLRDNASFAKERRVR